MKPQSSQCPSLLSPKCFKTVNRCSVYVSQVDLSLAKENAHKPDDYDERKKLWLDVGKMSHYNIMYCKLASYVD